MTSDLIDVHAVVTWPEDIQPPFDWVEGKTLLHIETQIDNPLGAGIPMCSIPKGSVSTGTRERAMALATAIVTACNASVLNAAPPVVITQSLLDSRVDSRVEFECWMRSRLVEPWWTEEAIESMFVRDESGDSYVDTRIARRWKDWQPAFEAARARDAIRAVATDGGQAAGQAVSTAWIDLPPMPQGIKAGTHILLEEYARAHEKNVRAAFAAASKVPLELGEPIGYGIEQHGSGDERGIAGLFETAEEALAAARANGPARSFALFDYPISDAMPVTRLEFERLVRIAMNTAAFHGQTQAEAFQAVMDAFDRAATRLGPPIKTKAVASLTVRCDEEGRRSYTLEGQDKVIYPLEVGTYRLHLEAGDETNFSDNRPS